MKERSGPPGLTIVSDYSNILHSLSRILLLKAPCAISYADKAVLWGIIDKCCTPAQQLRTALQVIKVGTSSLVRPEQNTLNLSNLARLCEVVRELKSQHHRYYNSLAAAVLVQAVLHSDERGFPAYPAYLEEAEKTYQHDTMGEGRAREG